MKEKSIYNKFYQNMPKVFFIFKMNKIEDNNLRNEHQKGNFVIFNQISPTFFIHKMSKNKPHTWSENLLDTRNGNLQVKSTIL